MNEARKKEAPPQGPAPAGIELRGVTSRSDLHLRRKKKYSLFIHEDGSFTLEEMVEFHD